MIRTTESSFELCEECFLHYKFQASKEEKKDIHRNQKTINMHAGRGSITIFKGKDDDIAKRS